MYLLTELKLISFLYGISDVREHLNLFRSQTTKGIWMAHCVGIEPCTLVMDLEGSDGRERGEVLLDFYLLT